MLRQPVIWIRDTVWICLCALSVYICLTGGVYADAFQTDPPGLPDTQELKLLQQKLAGLNQSVSLTGLNGDYLPGMMTVLYGNDLVRRGVMTVGEALTRVPGMATIIDANGNWSTVVRGLPKSLATTHFKFLLNGEPTHTLLGIDLIPNLPMEQIEKIEVIRGPASVQYGESAYAGVVNVVTKSKDTAFFTGAGDYDTYLAGATFSKHVPEKDLNMALNLAWLTTRRGDLDLGDGAGNGSVPINNADFDSPEYLPDGASPLLKDRSINEKSLLSMVMHLDMKGLSLDGHHIENGQGDFYTTVQQGVSLQKELTLSPHVTSTVSLEWLGQSSEEDYSNYRDPDQEGVYRVTYDAVTWQAGLDFRLDVIEDHAIRFDASVKKNEPVDLVRESEAGETNDSDKGRWLYSLMVQDTFHATDQLALTYGGRGDFYDDLGNRFSPRLAAVYRLNKKRNELLNHMLKVQVARAVRPQSFLEVNDVSADDFALKDPQVETVDTVELGYIFRTPETLARLTSFVSLIQSGPNAGVEDDPGADYRSFGIEIELEQDVLSDMLALSADGSWAHTRDTDTKDAPEGSVEYIAHAGLVWQLLPRIDLALQYTFTGRQIKDGGTTDPTHATDITLSMSRILKGLTLRGGVKNLFEDDVRYPSHLDQDRLIENGYLFYPGTYQKPERWWWVRVEYGF